MRRLTHVLGIGVLLALALVLAGCQQGVESAPAAPETVNIDMQDSRFVPQTAQVTPGATVRWVNRGDLPHTATADDGTFDSGNIAPGQAYSWTVPADAEPGTAVYYHCSLHGQAGDGESLGAGMAGELEVVAADEPAAPGAR